MPRIGVKGSIAKVKAVNGGVPTKRHSQSPVPKKQGRWIRQTKQNKPFRRRKWNRGLKRKPHAQRSIRAARATRSSQVAWKAAYAAGREIVSRNSGESELSYRQLKQTLRESFCTYWEISQRSTPAYETVLELGEAFRKGFASAYRYSVPPFLLLPSRKRTATVLCAYNEQDGIGAVLNELKRLSIDDIIVVINGSTDSTYEIVRQADADVTIVHYPHKLGHDVGRAIGAKAAQADITLFADSDILVSAEQFGAFLWAVESGIDVALNDLSLFIGRFDKQDSISHCKNWLNIIVGREDLGINSLTAIPHALSSRAITTIGFQALAIPPKAHVLAIMNGMRVKCVQSVDVISRNKLRESNVGTDNPMQKLILGDHIEAIKAVWDVKGDLLHEPQQVRSRIATRRNAI